MKVTEETISPKRAQELLDNHLDKSHQRKLIPAVVDGYARAMAAGQWMLTHQGIAIDTAGKLVDGQHRLFAIVQSGRPTRMLVTRGIPHNGNGVNSAGMYAIDAIDRGRTRSVGQQLSMRHGIENGTLTAAACRTVLVLVARSVGINQIGASTVGDTLRVLDAFGAELRYCIDNQSRLPGLRMGVVAGAFAFAMRPYSAQIKDAYQQCMTGESINRGAPMYALRSYLIQRHASTNGGTIVEVSRAVLNAARKHVLGEELTKVHASSEQGYDFFLDKQRPTVQKLLLSCGYAAKERVA